MAFSLSALLKPATSIARSTAAGGLAGGAALVLVMVAQAYGLTITPDQAASLVGVVIWLTVHFTPDSLKDHVKELAAKLNVSSKTVAQQLLEIAPQIEETYPLDPQPPFSANNIKKP